MLDNEKLIGTPAFLELWGITMRRLYRIYYNIFDDKIHNEILKEIRESFNAEVIDHPSKVHSDFRFIEVFLDEPGHEDELAGIVKVKAETLHVKVDWIDTSR